MAFLSPALFGCHLAEPAGVGSTVRMPVWQKLAICSSWTGFDCLDITAWIPDTLRLFHSLARSAMTTFMTVAANRKRMTVAATSRNLNEARSGAGGMTT